MCKTSHYYSLKVLTLGVIFCLPTLLFAQEYYYTSSKNAQGKYGILAQNRKTNIIDTLVSFKYYRTNVMEQEQFLVVNRSFPQLKNGKPYGTFYEGDVFDRNLKLVKHFDTLSTFQLNSANLAEFQFFENGKTGFYSAIFKGGKLTELYDEITSTDDLKVPGYKWHKPAYIARTGNSRTLIGPFGDSLKSLDTNDEISIFWQKLFKIYHPTTKRWDLIDLEGKIVAENVINQETCYGGRTTILTHTEGMQSLWYGPEQQLKPIPYEFPTTTAYNSQYLVGKGHDGLYYTLDFNGVVKSGPYEGFIKLNGTLNTLIKEQGKWRLEGPELKSFSDKRYNSIEILKGDRGCMFYIFKSGSEILAVSIHFDFVRVGGGTNIEIEVTDNRVCAKLNNKWAILTSNGFSDFAYDEIKLFSNNAEYAVARKGKKWMLINEEGIPLFETSNLKKIEFHSCELGDVFELKSRKNTAYFISNSNPDDVLFIYDDFACGDYGFCLKKKGKWGVVDDNGEILEDFKHTKLRDVVNLVF